MHKAILMLLLALLSNSAMAEWVKIDENETTSIYVDPATIDHDGNNVKMFRLFDFNTAELLDGVKSYLSSIGQDEYDCKEQQWRRLSLSVFSENMGEGEAMYNDYEVSNWKPVSPSIISKSLWKYACGKPY